MQLSFNNLNGFFIFKSNKNLYEKSQKIVQVQHSQSKNLNQIFDDVFFIV